MDTKSEGSVKAAVQDFYTVERKSEDFEISICSRPQAMSPSIQKAIALVHPEVQNRYYGCGMTIPSALEGQCVLDLGSGCGRDCFALSRLVGPQGHVTGLDMTDELLEFSRQHIPYHMEKFGFSKHNVDFKMGYIEKLKDAGLEDSTFDVIVSNCVVNLSHDKRAVLAEAYRVLKTGGEMFFSDMYVDRHIPEEVKGDKALWVEGLTGALHWRDLYQLAEDIGFSTPRLFDAYSIPLKTEETRKRLGDAQYAGVTFRLFKLPPELSPPKKATYKGDVTDNACSLKFDFAHTFQTGVPMLVDGTLASILASSRYSAHFALEECKVDMKIDPFEHIAKKGRSCSKSCPNSTQPSA